MKICIVGGGSSGWMTASTLVKAFPKWDITLIESPKVPTVGVGESTTQYFRHWVHFLGLKDEDWMPHCDATYKISVRFHNFHKVGDDPWQYPFGIPRKDIPPDVWWYGQSKRGWNNSLFAQDFYLAAYCAERNLLPVDHEHFSIPNHTGFHFDAVKFSNWLRDNYAVPRGVKHIQKHVDRSVILDDNYDLFFDCTGFKSLLNDSEWVDYSDFLPNNSAWVTRLPYINKEQEMKPVTDCTALSSGWVWNVPTWERIGTGYNFCDKYISEEDALHEFATHLKVDNHEQFRLIKYKTGRKKEIWNGRVVSIGLSAGFIEPLESNGLLSTHLFLLQFCRVMAGKDHITQFMRDTFNHDCHYNFDGFSSFVALHYALTQRNDSPYWKAVSNIKYPYRDLFQSAQVTYMEQSLQFPVKMTWEHESLWCVMAGHGWNPFNDVIHDELNFFGGVPDDAFANTFEVQPWEDIDTMTTPLNYYQRTLYAS